MKKGESRKEKETDSRRRREGGFTLLELIVVLAILTVLIGAVVFALDPLQITAKTRDTTRMADLEAITGALAFADSDAPISEEGGFDLDGSNTGTCADELTPTVYVSVPNSVTPPDDLPYDWTYAQVNATDLQNIDGSGWLPVNFTAGGGTSPISALPIDVSNKFSSGFYYSYVCNSDGTFELNTRMVSNDKRTGGASDVQSNDGGDDIFTYEAGSNLTLSPTAPIGYWAFDEGSGTAVTDSVGDNDGSFTSGTPAWIASCISGSCLDFDEAGAAGNGEEVLINNTNYGLSEITAIAWINPDTSTDARASIFRIDGFYFQFLTNNRTTTYWYDWTLAGYHNSPVNSVLPSQWYHVASVWDNDRGTRLYVNGLETFQLNNSSVTPRTTNWIRFGREGATRRYNGRVDEAILYDRPLTEVELTYQYNSLKP